MSPTDAFCGAIDPATKAVCQATAGHGGNHYAAARGPLGAIYLEVVWSQAEAPSVTA